ncbi:hypothetical protein [Pseudoxanthomonas mexicana]
MPKELTGPEALHAIARENEAHGLTINADHFTRLGNQWQALEQYVELLESERAEHGKPLPPRPLPSHAVTPSDRRH